MAAVIYKGSTPTLRFKPTNGMHVSDLGTPTVAIVQAMVYLEPEVTVDTTNNCITVHLSEDDTLQLVPGARTRAQQMWVTSSDEVIRFPEHEIEVKSTLVHKLIVGIPIENDEPTV